jgi:hypothetical protein
MPQTPEETNEICATWIPPKGLVNNDSNGVKIAKYILENGGYFSHSNLFQALINLKNELEWEKPPAPKVRTVDPPNIGGGSLKSHRSHKEMTTEAKAEKNEALSTLQLIQGVMRKLDAERADVPVTIWKNGKIDHAATQAARARTAKK